MGEARQVETEAATYLDQVSRYFISRAKLISKVAKYPHIVSFKFHHSQWLSTCILYVVRYLHIVVHSKWLSTHMQLVV